MLTESQARALGALAHYDHHAPGSWHGVGATEGPDGERVIVARRTAEALERLGLVETRATRSRLDARGPFGRQTGGTVTRVDVDVRITDEGRELLARSASTWRNAPAEACGGDQLDLFAPSHPIAPPAERRVRDRLVMPAEVRPSWPIVVSYGMGVDSTAALVLLKRSGITPGLIVFADTGGEHPATYAYLHVINDWLRRVEFPQVTVVKYTPVTAEYDTLYDNCIAKGMLPSIAYGSHQHGCSLKFKVAQIDALVRRWPPAIAARRAGGRVVRVIGYDDSAADQGRRERFEVQGDKAASRGDYYVYPLQLVGWDRERCIAEIQAEGLPVPPKSACYFCPSTRPHELVELAIEHPDLAWKILALEAAAAGNLSTIDGLWRAEVKGVRGGVPKPGSMTEFLLVWMVDGRAYRVPRAGEAGIVPREMALRPRYAKAYRSLPLLDEVDTAVVDEIRRDGERVARELRARYEATYGPVDGFLAAVRARAERRAIARAAKRRSGA